MTWEQFIFTITAIAVSNVLAQVALRGLFGNKDTAKGMNGSGSSGQILSDRIDDVRRDIDCLKKEIESKVGKEYCELAKSKIEDVIEEIWRKLEAIDKSLLDLVLKVDRILQEKEYSTRR
jgi:hypothetical protein